MIVLNYNTSDTVFYKNRCGTISTSGVKSDIPVGNIFGGIPGDGIVGNQGDSHNPTTSIDTPDGAFTGDPPIIFTDGDNPISGITGEISTGVKSASAQAAQILIFSLKCGI